MRLRRLLAQHRRYSVALANWLRWTTSAYSSDVVYISLLLLGVLSRAVMKYSYFYILEAALAAGYVPESSSAFRALENIIAGLFVSRITLFLLQR
jgi:hypothetical protein